jgi:hypothetical protein
MIHHLGAGRRDVQPTFPLPFGNANMRHAPRPTYPNSSD